MDRKEEHLHYPMGEHFWSGYRNEDNCNMEMFRLRVFLHRNRTVKIKKINGTDTVRSMREVG